MFNYEPTLGTLRYASRARAIQNRVKQNNKYTLEDEIIYLRRQACTVTLLSSLSISSRVINLAKVCIVMQTLDLTTCNAVVCSGSISVDGKAEKRLEHQRE
jgi:hypothetical protein